MNALLVGEVEREDDKAHHDVTQELREPLVAPSPQFRADQPPEVGVAHEDRGEDTDVGSPETLHPQRRHGQDGEDERLT